ncbi:hypothetical protein [Burkholderia lata]|uniref:hypothetical protein n=1 Tax=Burkholderia lata (strain ATCC 17760 / DSM 23089 / LMG 22485 / NCIMB 9086 / R18194 / 383) TaxID=482957 RepID=UPI00158240F9|nr:hypothetical protein [Burkholderia lata]
MKKTSIFAVLCALATSTAVAATQSSISASATAVSAKDRTVRINVLLKGDIVVRRVQPNAQNSTSKIRIFVNNTEVASYTATQLKHSAEYPRYDNVQNCNQNGCWSTQLIFSNTAQVEASHIITLPPGVRSVPVYATFDGDRYSTSATSGKFDATPKSATPVGALDLLLND